MTEHAYQGGELDLFAQATRWKSYVAAFLRPWLGGSVLEVGAGIGGTTRWYWNESVTAWLCLEPDPTLAARIDTDRPGTAVRVGTVTDLLHEPARFDATLYVDVLEHVEDDRGEIERAARLLNPGGRVIVVAPAHQFLYSPFDRAIGHFRRYDRRSLRAIAPAGLREERIAYLDCAGLLASALNRLLLRASRPTLRQILFWDRRLVPLSARLDRPLRYRIGKSVVGVWRQPAGGAAA